MREDVCIIIDATADDEFTRFNFKSIQRSLKDKCAVYLLTNLATGTQADWHINIDNKAMSGAVENYKSAKTVVPGNEDLKIIAALNDERLRRCQKFIRLEYDVLARRELTRAFLRLIDIADEHDFGGSNIFTKKQFPGWVWWDSLHNQRDPDLEAPKSQYAGLISLMIFSRAFIDVYARYLAAGWVGHYEALMPSVAHWENLRVCDFSRGPNRIVVPEAFTIHRPQNMYCKETYFLHPVKNVRDFVRAPAEVWKNYAQHVDMNDFESFRFISNLLPLSCDMDLIKQELLEADTFLNFGATEISVLALNCGVRHVCNIGLNAALLEDSIRKYVLQKFCNIGRLSLRHVDIGKTDNQGHPVAPYDRGWWIRYISNSWSDIRPSFIYIGGRFRVAIAAESYIRLSGAMNYKIYIENYTKSAHYKEIERIYRVVSAGSSGAILEPLEDRTPIAREILEAFREDAR